MYASTDKLTAYMELLAPYRTEINGKKRSLQKDADFIGVELGELWSRVVAEWDEAGTMKARWLPRAFRQRRMLYKMRFPSGWWVDVNATETISVINDQFAGALPTVCGPSETALTLSQITGEDRVLTTTIEENDTHLMKAQRYCNITAR